MDRVSIHSFIHSFKWLAVYGMDQPYNMVCNVNKVLFWNM